MHSTPTPLSGPSKRVPLPEALRRDIAAMVQALPNDELLALVGDRLADLVARHAVLAPPTHEEPRPASSLAKPRAPSRSTTLRIRADAPIEKAAPERGRKAPVLP